MVMAAAELSRLRFKGPTRPVVNPVTDTVKTTATRILNNNPDRVEVLIVNLSDNRGHIGFDSKVGPTRGIPVEAQGGFVSMCIEEDGETVGYEIFARNQVAAGKWYILEVERF